MNIFGLQGIAETINAFASEEIKKHYLPGFASGQFTGAMALTEPDAGSDLQRVRLKASQDANGLWRLNGVKRFITNGCGEILLVLARSEPKEEGGLGLSLFLCERGDGVRIRRLEDKLGIHGSPTCEIEFNDAPSLLIGERRRGLVTYVMALMNGARLGIAGQSLGIGQASLEVAKDFAHTRQQFGERIENIPAVAEMLLDMEVELEAARALTYETAYIVDLYQSLALKLEESDEEAKKKLRPEVKGYERLAGFLTPCCKYYASEMSVTVSSRAIQVLGGSGYMRDYAVERLFRDSRITTIYEGTSQLQIVAAVRGVLAGMAEKRFKEMAGWTFAPGLEKNLKMLATARVLLDKAVSFLKARGHDYTELYARYLVDIAIDIYLGYLLLRQVTLEEKRSRLSQRFFAGFRPRLLKNYLFIKSGDITPLIG
jgi:alkylation response protein AidB-like acyl-CoA dehydrogenase